MVMWSSLHKLGASAFKNIFIPKSIIRNLKTSAIKNGGHGDRTFEIKPTTWQWDKFKDYIHFYVLVGAIPCLSIVLYTNIFIGEATLTEIPEGYTPKHWEYYKHPITRFIAKYIHAGHQQHYEVELDLIYEQDEKLKMEKLVDRVNAMMQEKEDYAVYYYKPISTRTFRKQEEEYKEFRDKW